jgi:hypothetical protein
LHRTSAAVSWRASRGSCASDFHAVAPRMALIRGLCGISYRNASRAHVWHYPPGVAAIFVLNRALDAILRALCSPLQIDRAGLLHTFFAGWRIYVLTCTAYHRCLPFPSIVLCMAAFASALPLNRASISA